MLEGSTPALSPGSQTECHPKKANGVLSKSSKAVLDLPDVAVECRGDREVAEVAGMV